MIENIQYPVGSVVECTIGKLKGIFHPHPFLCVVSGYSDTYNPENSMVVNGLASGTNFISLYPYNFEAFADYKKADLSCRADAEFIQISMDTSNLKYIKPFLFQFQEVLLRKSDNAEFKIVAIDFESSTGRIGNTKEFARVQHPRGFIFQITYITTGQSFWITLNDLQTKYTLK